MSLVDVHIFVYVYVRPLTLGLDLPRKCSPYRKFTPGPSLSQRAMAGEMSTELLFLDTFKHQSAEVTYLMPPHIGA